MAKPVASDDDAPSLSGAEGDAEPAEDILRCWAHKVSKAGVSKQRKLKKVDRRIQADSDANITMLRQMLAPNVGKEVLPPKASAGRKWTMVDSGSQPSVAESSKEFPASSSQSR